jgi:hypothetical protein
MAGSIRNLRVRPEKPIAILAEETKIRPNVERGTVSTFPEES